MIPEHYSRDITERCQSLLRHLMPKVKAGLPDDRKFRGTLQTTFLLAMATPMIVLPIERIFKRNVAANDRELDRTLASCVADVFGSDKSFGEAPFFGTARWSYVHNHSLFNIANNWPPELLKELAAQDAIERAKTTPVRRILLDLRNALAHGGITYLDEDGKNTRGQATMFAFAGANMNRRESVGLNILRITEEDFCDFLMRWADWLQERGIMDKLNMQDHFAA